MKSQDKYNFCQCWKNTIQHASPRVEVFKATKLTILNGLPPKFTYTNFTTFAVSKGVNLRTSKRWLSSLLTKKVIKRLDDERGYIKVSKPYLKFK